MRRKTATALPSATALIAALALAGCQDAGETEPDGDTGTTPTAPAPTPDGDDETDDATDDTDETDDSTDAADDTDDADETDDAEDADDGADDTADNADNGADDTGNGDDDATDDSDDIDAADLPAFVGPDEQLEQRPDDAAQEVGQEIIDVRVAGQDGFDRVVFELSGDEVRLGWLAAYQDVATDPASGEPVEVAGSSVLSVPILGIDWQADPPERYDGQTVAGADTDNVTEVVFDIIYAGEQQIFIGVDDQTPYRVFALNDPARIVVDLEHP
ncbi:AMIN-like domain-containing (lipo)protein [Ornithinimicrobium sp. Y1847]|uniref:AMIN-like domain-containing (lipo)protein n=1 Tax=Ornithinimicrobium sp. Y1847 TaxID=3405419 RepID=UPI003B6779A6